AAQGGSFISNHAASDSYGHSTASSVSGNGKGIWDWYSENVTGCSVRNSPNHTRAGLGATVTVQNQNSGLTNGIVFPWSDNEEWYYWEDGYLDSSFTELLRVSDTGSNSYDDARMTAHYWERPDGGVSFYSSMGHAKSKYSDSDFVQLMSNAFAFILD
ncbi:MAG: ThuA domain-containing protein, partial [Maribacter sp.]